MNRFRKEERAAHRAARSGLSELEIAQLDQDEAVETEIVELARVIHAEKFPEEYDHYFDSIFDAMVNLCMAFCLISFSYNYFQPDVDEGEY